MPAFELRAHELEGATLRPLSPANAASLGEALAAMPPWSTIGWPADRMTASLRRKVPSVRRFEIVADGELAGIAVIQNPFLIGPYLQIFAMLPPFQGRNLGTRVLEWMETEARSVGARQLWLCVSTFNTRAQSFYERFGFRPAVVLDKLASDASDEILMRKRLTV